ncbi:MAG: hypothetical protein KGO82_14375 [Bacteroidota bacterium]|nr:hypothetical protein [Bacteroidota bacterium]
MKPQFKYFFGGAAIMAGALCAIRFAGDARFAIGTIILSLAAGLTCALVYNNNQKKFQQVEKSVTDEVKKQVS